MHTELRTEPSTADLAAKAKILRSLHYGPRPLVLPNAWDVASARLVEQSGFAAVATSSGAVTATLGYEDTNSMPPDEAFRVVTRIARAVSVPVTADMEAGYDLSPVDFVARLLEAGAVGCNLEDTDHQRVSALVDADDHAARLQAVKSAAKQFGVDIVLNARIDALNLQGHPDDLFEEAVRRARLYLQAGADSVFPIRLADENRIRVFISRVDGPVNIVPSGVIPLARLAELGVARVSYAGLIRARLYENLDRTLSEIASAFGVLD